MGLIFQILDDILDVTGNAAELVKQTGSDADNNKSSVTAIVGVDKAQQMIEELSSRSLAMIDKLPRNREFFYQFIDFLKNRMK